MVKRFPLSPKTTIQLISYYPPYLLSGISVVDYDEDLTRITSQLKSSFWNRNYVGTHFGGSLYAMCDPFYMFILLKHLGKDHIIWDRAAEISFEKAITGPVRATFSISPEELSNLREQALQNFKVEPLFNTAVVDEKGEVVARVMKKLYIRRKDAKERFFEKQ